MRLELRNIAHSFFYKSILENCSYTFNEGKIYAIQGSNGSGKTTLFNIINGFIEPTAGEILLDGIHLFPTESVSQRNKRGVLRLWQNGEIFKHLSTIDNLRVVPDHKGNNLLNYLFQKSMTKEQEENITTRALAILKLLGLTQKADLSAGNLSYGQQRIAAFGRLLMDERVENGKTIILLDEPFSGVHSKMLNIISDKIKDMANQGNIILIIEHNFKRINEIADVILEIKNKELKELE
ncbi:ATP-binding cassette domain-containing protein [Pontimicrobium sp. MEBiC06410]